jgi:hypothetical protein
MGQDHPGEYYESVGSNSTVKQNLATDRGGRTLIPPSS